MTGFGRCVETVDGLNITVEIKSVNHRYFEFSSRMSRAYQFAEEPLKSLCAKNIRNTYRVSFIALFHQDFEFDAATLDVAEEYVRAMYREGKFRVDRRTSGDDVSSHLAEAELQVDRAKVVFEYEYCGSRKALVE
jgi:hypothetical protein